MSCTTGALIVIRGPAGSGKSTVAERVVQQLRADKVPVAYLEQDYFRNIVAGGGGTSRDLSRVMLRACALSALAAG